MREKFRVLFIYPNTMMATLIPLHIPVLSACLKEQGIDVRLFDTTYYKTEEKNFEQKKVELLQVKRFSLEDGGITFKKTNIFDDLRELVRDYRPNLIAMPLVEDVYKLGMDLLSSIRDFNIPVIVGGVFVNFYKDELINNSLIDMLCIGEGEKALVELCKAMHNGEDYNTIGNLWVKSKAGTITKNSVRELTDLNQLPFIDLDIFEPSRMGRPMQGKIFRMLHVEVQRGCPFGCTYCEAPALRKFYQDQGYPNYFRRKKPKRLIEEMKYLVEKYTPDYINFAAESFLAIEVEELEELSELYKREISLPFWCQSRPETITDQKIKIIKDMGCSDMQFGIEHGNEQFRAKMLNRHCTNERIVNALRVVEKYQIPYTVNNIIGFPGETRDLIFDTISLNRLLNPKTINCYMFTPYRGTFLRDYSVEKGYLDKNASTMQLLDGADFNFDTITKTELLGLQRTFSLYARLPESEFNKIRIAEKFDSEGNDMFKRLSDLYYQSFF